jgi:hypothetical protein
LTGAAKRQNARQAGRFVKFLPLLSVTVLLDARGAQAGKTMIVDGRLPGQELLDGQLVSLASLVEAQQPAANGSHDLGLPANDPATRVAGGQIGNRQRAAVRPDYIFDTRSHKIGHRTLYNIKDPIDGHTTATALRKG